MGEEEVIIFPAVFCDLILCFTCRILES
jgi:hypothetical protein